MKKTILLAVTALTVSVAVNAQTDTTGRDTTGKRDTLRRDSTQAQAFAKNTTGMTVAQVNVLNSLKTVTSDIIKPKDY